MLYYLFTDLDRTLLPNGLQQADTQAIELLHTLHDTKQLQLVYVSGRDKGLIQSAIDVFNLPTPDFAIADVGTKIYRIDHHDWLNNTDWERHLAKGWDETPLNQACEQLTQTGSIRKQEPEKQTRFKLSFYLKAEDLGETMEQQVRQIIEQAGLPVRIIQSLDETTQTGLLDILPESASKYHAIRFLMQQYNIADNQVVFAGDSGNDMEVLVSEIPAVLVKNALKTVKQQALELSKQYGHTEQLYIAKGNFLTLNGNYCSGILEGLSHYIPDVKHWLQACVASD